MDSANIDTKLAQFGSAVFGLRAETKDKSSSKTALNSGETCLDNFLNAPESDLIMLQSWLLAPTSVGPSKKFSLSLLAHMLDSPKHAALSVGSVN